MIIALAPVSTGVFCFANMAAVLWSDCCCPCKHTDTAVFTCKHVDLHRAKSRKCCFWGRNCHSDLNLLQNPRTVTTKATNQEPVAKVVLLKVEENKRLYYAKLLCKHFPRCTHNWGLVAEEVDGIQAFTLQQIQTQPLVPALRKNIETDESTWKTTNRSLWSAAAELYPAHLQTVCFLHNNLCINAENKQWIHCLFVGI